jgi:DNA adenine methylase
LLSEPQIDLQPPFQRPFLKWAGNKFQVLPRILAQLPAGSALLEPFAGSAAVSLNSNHPRFVINDVNPDLITLYRTLQAQGEAFIGYARSLFTPGNNTEAAYYALRERFNRSTEPTERAALFLYLNRHGYNGLCRYNAAHGFNVPFGRYRGPYFPLAEMHAFIRRAAAAEFTCVDFETAMDRAEPGQVVYADPPYVPLNATANFTAYSSGGFSAAEQTALAHKARALAARGVSVLISNHDTEFTRDLYTGARISAFQVQRFISCKGDQRNPAGEVLALFAPPS